MNPGVGGVDDADADPGNEVNTSLDLTGSLLQITDAGGTLSVNLSGINSNLSWISSGADIYTWDSLNGVNNVGINTVTPQANLEVVGDSMVRDGDLIISSPTNANTYVQLDTTTTTPPASDCNAVTIGRMIYDRVTDTLWICGESPIGWKAH
ncbi:MAG: hypothetical protein AAF492_24765 [Verrucomicrobiota bacterium]